MKKAIADLIVESKEEMIGKIFVQSPVFIENRLTLAEHLVVYLEILLTPGTLDDYNVMIHVITQAEGKCMPGVFNFYYFERHFHRRTVEDKLKILYLEAARKFELLRQSHLRFQGSIHDFFEGGSPTPDKDKFDLLMDWSVAQDEHSYLLCHIRDGNINPKSYL